MTITPSRSSQGRSLQPLSTQPRRWVRFALAFFFVLLTAVSVSTPAWAEPAPSTDAQSGGTQSGGNQSGGNQSGANTTAAPSAGAGATDPNNAAGNLNQTAPDPPGAQDGGGSNAQLEDSLKGSTGMLGQAARSSLSAALNRLGLWTTPKLNQPDEGKPNWFVAHYRMMRVMGLYILMPMILIAILHSVLKASLSMLLKCVFAYLPIAIIGTTVAIDFVQLLLDVTDSFSALFINAILADSNTFFTTTAQGFANTDVPYLLNLFLGLVLGLVCLFVYVIMVVREASIYVATSFLPIGFAMMVWPSTAQWFKKMVEFIIGVILSKILIVACISLAIAAFAAPFHGSSSASSAGLSVDGTSMPAQVASGTVTGGSAGAAVSKSDGAINVISNEIAAIALMVITCFAPGMTVNLVGRLGVGEMAAHVGGALTRPSGIQQLLFYDRIMLNKMNFDQMRSAMAATTESKHRAAAAPSMVEQRLNSMGIYRNDQGNFQITDQQLTEAGVDGVHHALLKDMTNPTLNPDNANNILMAHAALGLGENFDGFKGGPTRTPSRTNPSAKLGSVLFTKTGASKLVINVANREGRVLRSVPPALIRRALRDEADRQIAAGGVTSNGIVGIDVIVPMRTRPGQAAGAGGAAATANFERRLERNIADAVRDVKKEYRRDDGGRVNINSQFRAPASAESRVNRPLDPVRAGRVEGRF